MVTKVLVGLILTLFFSGCASTSSYSDVDYQQLERYRTIYAEAQDRDLAIRYGEATLEYYETFIELVEPMLVDRTTVSEDWQAQLERIKEYTSREETVELFEKLKVDQHNMILLEMEIGNYDTDISYRLTMKSIESFMHIDETLSENMENAIEGTTYEDSVLDVLFHGPASYSVDNAKEWVDSMNRGLKVLYIIRQEAESGK